VGWGWEEKEEQEDREGMKVEWHFLGEGSRLIDGDSFSYY
jgi:hypothetical protein